MSDEQFDPRELLSILKDIVGDVKMIEQFKSRVDAEKELRSFLKKEKCNFKVGDIVERNEIGLTRYLLPKANQVAIVVEVWPKPVFDGTEFNDMVVCIALAKGLYRYHTVNSSYYKEGTTKPASTYVFREKAEGRLDA